MLRSRQPQMSGARDPLTVNIPGPAGKLEATLTHADAGNGQFAVLCHPHPLYGGNMHDAVLAVLESALVASGRSCLRFNFRGAGLSDGDYSGGEGEAADLEAAIAWLEAEHHPASLVLGGYSFGAHVVWRCLDAARPERVLLIAPPVGLMDFSARTPSAPVDVFSGDDDDYVDLAALASLEGAVTHVIEGANHFF